MTWGLLAAALLRAQIPEAAGTPVDGPALKWIELSEGTGAPASAGMRYTVHYTGWLTDGKKFDSSRDRDEPLTFVQGRRRLIAGWEMGFEGMKVGGKRRLIIPHQMAYGEKGSGPIPPRSELIFDIELMAVEDAPTTPAAQDALLALDEIERKVAALAGAVPEEEYAWRPQEDTDSFSEVLTGRPLSKSSAAVEMRESFDSTRKNMEASSAGALARETTVDGVQTTQMGAFIRTLQQWAERYGRARAYAEQMGVTPPR